MNVSHTIINTFLTCYIPVLYIIVTLLSNTFIAMCYTS